MLATKLDYFLLFVCVYPRNIRIYLKLVRNLLIVILHLNIRPSKLSIIIPIKHLLNIRLQPHQILTLHFLKDRYEPLLILHHSNTKQRDNKPK